LYCAILFGRQHHDSVNGPVLKQKQTQWNILNKQEKTKNNLPIQM
jgi:hypothetical protein